MVAVDGGIVFQDLPLATVTGTDNATVQEFKGGERDIEVGYEDEEPETLEERMPAEPLSYPANFDLGEQEDEEKEGEDVERGDILEAQSTQSSEIASYTQIEGEVWIEEGEVAERFIVGSPSKEYVHCL